MKFIEASPDIPNELIREINDGEVVFLCGAGVSRGAGLPSFRTLTDQVYAKLGESRGNEAAERIAYDRTEYDRVLRFRGGKAFQRAASDHATRRNEKAAATRTEDKSHTSCKVWEYLRSGPNASRSQPPGAALWPKRR
jgi:NAD-dependent SIR2 family protein deacetylase